MSKFVFYLTISVFLAVGVVHLTPAWWHRWEKMTHDRPRSHFWIGITALTLALLQLMLLFL